MGTVHLLLSYFKKNYIWGEIFVVFGLANTSNCLMWMIKYMLKISSNQSPSTNLLIPNHSILGYFWNYSSFCSHEKNTRYFFPYQKNKPIFCSPSNTRIPVGVNPSLYSCWSRPCKTERHLVHKQVNDPIYTICKKTQWLINRLVLYFTVMK